MGDRAVPAAPVDAVTPLIMRLGGMLGTPVRVRLAGDRSRATGILTAFRLAQDGGAGGVYVTLRDHPGELKVDRIEPAGPPGPALPAGVSGDG